MKKIFFALMVSAFMTNSVFAADAPPAAADPKKQEMMKKWMEYATPNENHKVFATMTGKWKYTSKWWEKADGKPEESRGTSTIKTIMGGRFLQHETKGKAMGQPFQGLGFTGYDNLKGKYETLWFDSMGTGIMHGTGTYDASTKTLKDSGDYSCPMSDDKKREYRGEWKIIDKNTMSYTMYGPSPDDSDEFKQAEMTFKRIR